VRVTQTHADTVRVTQTHADTVRVAQTHADTVRVVRPLKRIYVRTEHFYVHVLTRTEVGVHQTSAQRATWCQTAHGSSSK